MSGDLKYDLEQTRQWAIAAEKELVEMRARAVKAEAELKEQNSEALLAKINQLELGINYWHTSHTQVTNELLEANQVIDDLTDERNRLYESLS